MNRFRNGWLQRLWRRMPRSTAFPPVRNKRTISWQQIGIPPINSGGVRFNRAVNKDQRAEQRPSVTCWLLFESTEHVFRWTLLRCVREECYCCHWDDWPSHGRLRDAIDLSNRDDRIDLLIFVHHHRRRRLLLLQDVYLASTNIRGAHRHWTRISSERQTWKGEQLIPFSFDVSRVLIFLLLFSLQHIINKSKRTACVRIEYRVEHVSIEREIMKTHTYDTKKGTEK